MVVAALTVEPVEPLFRVAALGRNVLEASRRRPFVVDLAFAVAGRVFRVFCMILIRGQSSRDVTI